MNPENQKINFPTQPTQSNPDILPAEATTEQPVSPTPNVPPIEQDNLKPKNKVLLILVAVLIIIGLGLLGYWVYQNYFATFKFTKGVVPTPFATTDPTLNWKTYTNLKYGFTVKHPEDFKVDESQQQIMLYKGEKIKPTSDFSATDPYGNTVSMQFDFRSLLSVPSETCSESGVVMGACAMYTNSNQTFIQNNITINNATGLYVQADDYRDTREIYYLIGPKGGGVITISLWNDNEKKSKADMELLRQILSTFRVIDKEAPTSWKTYNGKYFSFKYPGEFFLHEDEVMKTLAVHSQDFSMPTADVSRQVVPFWVQIWPKTAGVTIKDYITQNNIEALFVDNSVGTAYTLNSLSGYYYEGQMNPYFAGKDVYPSILVILEDSENIYTIANYFATDKFTFDVFNQILSTFNFND